MAGVSLVLVAVLVAAQPQPTETPRDILRQATRAVEGDSVAAVRARFETRASQRPDDLGALLGLATLHRLSYDADAAEGAFRELLARSHVSTVYAGHAHDGLGVLAIRRGALAQAEDHLATARRLLLETGDSATAASVIGNLAAIRARTAGADAALQLLAEADAVAQGPSLIGLIRCRRAMTMLQAGREGAIDEARAGLEATRRGDERSTEAFCHAALASVFTERAEFPDALAEISASIELYRAARDHYAVAAMLQRRGQVNRMRGDLGSALEDLREVIVNERAGMTSSAVAWSHIELSRIHSQFGDAALAGRHLAEAESMFIAQGDQWGVLMARQGHALQLARSGALAEARDRYAEVLSLAQERGLPLTRFLTHYMLAAIAMREGDLDRAEHAIEAADDVVHAHGLGNWQSVVVLARSVLALQRADYASAERGFSQYIAAAGADQWRFRYEARARLAEVHARRGDAVMAEAELQAAWNELSAWRASLTRREDRLRAFEVHDPMGDPDLGIATVLAALTRAGRVESALHLAEQRRGRELADRLLRIEAVARSAATSVDQARSPAPIVLDAGAIQQAIPDDRTAILVYVTGRGGEPSLVFAVTRQRIHAHELEPIDSLDADVRRFARLVETGADARSLGRQLAGRLLHAVVSELPASVNRLVVVSDDVLHRLPYDALVLDDGRYVIERFSVSHAPSATVATQLWRNRGRPRPATLLALGDPRFADEGAAPPGTGEVYRAAFDAEGGLPRLRASGREARRVARFAARADVRLRDRASADYVKRAPLRDYSVLHVASHARVDESAMTRTAIALAPSDGDDGFLGVADLLDLDLDADLVVLSACRTAGGVIVGGEGMEGLAASLLAAGARSVAATAWPIGDRTTLRLVEDFYRSMADGLAVGDALREAKLGALRRGAPPAQWAAFTLTGDPLVEVPLRRPSRSPLIGLFGFGLLVLAYGAWRILNQRNTVARSAPSWSDARTHH